MLAIVIPVILATLGVAFWFRASNQRARYRPNFAYSGRLEMLVWSIPAMTVFLVGGVAWVGSHGFNPRKPLVSTVIAAAGRSRLARLEMAVHLSERRRRERQSARHPDRRAGAFQADVVGRHEQLLRAAARQPDLHDGRHDLAAQPASGSAGRLSGNFRAVQRRRLFRHALCRARLPPDDYAKWIASAKAGGKALDMTAYAALARQSGNVQAATYHSVDPKLFDAIVDETAPPSGSVAGAAGGHSTSAAGEAADARQAHLGRHSVRPADPLGASALMIVVVLGVLVWVTLKGHWPYLWRRVDHLGRSQAHRRDVLHAGAGRCCCAASWTPS